MSTRVPGWPNSGAAPSEFWAAYVDGSGHGIGAFFPGTPKLTCYRYPGDGTAGPAGSACSYFAPIRRMRWRAGEAREYEVWLRIGDLAVMRREFAGLQASTGTARCFAVRGIQGVGAEGVGTIVFPGGAFPRATDAAGRRYNRIWRPSLPSAIGSR